MEIEGHFLEVEVVPEEPAGEDDVCRPFQWNFVPYCLEDVPEVRRTSVHQHPRHRKSLLTQHSMVKAVERLDLTVSVPQSPLSDELLRQNAVHY